MRPNIIREETLSDFSPPWCQILFKDPAWKPILTLARIKADYGTSNKLLSEALWTPGTIRAVQSFEKPKAKPTSSGGGGEEDDEVIEEVCMLFSLGKDLEGLTGACHGAVVTLMLDEAMALMAAVTIGGFNGATATLNVGFKKAVGIPRVVLCRACFDKERPPQGRKYWVKATLEDGEGGIFATGEALFLRLREKL